MQRNCWRRFPASLREVIPTTTLAWCLYDEAGRATWWCSSSESGQLKLFQGIARFPSMGSLSGIRVSAAGAGAAGKYCQASYAPQTSLTSSEWECSRVAGVPLVHHGNALGALSVVSRQEGVVGQRELEMLCTIAGQVAMAVDKTPWHSGRHC